MGTQSPEISVVIPVYNEVESLRPLFERLAATMTAYGRGFEVIAVDDGSSDGSLAVLEELREPYPWLRIVQLARNFGQSAALFAGFAHVRGERVIMLDADLQNPPEEIPKVLDKLTEGYDMVSGWRQARQDSVLRTLPSRALNLLFQRITKTELHDLGCALKGFRREAVDQLVTCTHRSRYITAEIASLRLKMGEVKVAHAARELGESKYGLTKLVKTAFDLITSVTTAPIRLIAYVGVAFISAGALVIGAVAGAAAGGLGWNNTAFLVGWSGFLTGVNLVTLGLLGEYISRIFTEVQGRPFYVVRRVIE